MTELSFLLELLLNHKLPKPTKEAITNRIKEVEARVVQPITMSTPRAIPRAPSAQSPSTQRILDEMAAEGQVLPGAMTIPVGSIPDMQMIPAQVAQTPAAQAALARRQEAIAIAISGKEEKGRISPRKF